MSYALVAATLASVLAFAVFLYLVRVRWFARFEAGFLVALTLAVGGFGFVTASLFGFWAYDRGRAVLIETLHDQLQNLADVIEEETVNDLKKAHSHLIRLTKEVGRTRSFSETAALAKVLARVQRFEPRFVQLDVLDDHGDIVVSHELDGRPETVDPASLAAVRNSEVFVSEPFFSSLRGRYLLIVGVPMTDSSGKNGALLTWYDIQEDLVDVLKAALFGKTGRAVLIDAKGVIFAHPDTKVVGTDVSDFTAVQDAWRGETGWVVAPNNEGIERLFVYRPMPKIATGDSKPWVLLAGIDTAEAFAPIHHLTVEFAVGFVAILLACVLLSRQLAVSIRRPVQELVEFARRVGQGDLQQRAAIEGRDEMGQLSGALNEMVSGLQDRDRVKEIFGRYVTTSVSEEILRGNLNLGGERRNLSILISDVRNFTAMSEKLPPEEVVGFLNEYFTEMVEAVFEQGGILDKFIGDGLLAVFGALDESPDHARRAVRAALRMRELVEAINERRALVHDPPFAIGIGINTDDVVVGNIGSRRRLEYTVIGDGVNTASRVESLNKEFGTTILITESTYDALNGEFVCRPMPEAHLKGKEHAPKVFEVVGEKTG